MRRRPGESEAGALDPEIPEKKTRGAAKRPFLSPSLLPVLQEEHTGNDEVIALLLDISSCLQAMELNC